MPEYDDEEFLDAVEGLTTTHRVADGVGCTPVTAHRRLYDLAKAGEVAFEYTPLRRESKKEKIVRPAEDAIEALHISPEEWPEPLDEESPVDA